MKNWLIIAILPIIFVTGIVGSVNAETLTTGFANSASQYTNSLAGGYCGAFGDGQALGGHSSKISNAGFTDPDDPEPCIISVNKLDISNIPKSAIIQSTQVIMTMNNIQTFGPVACDYTGNTGYIPLFDGTQRDQDKIISRAVGLLWRPYVLNDTGCQFDGVRPSVDLGLNANNDVSFSLNNNNGIFVLNVLPYGFEPYGSDPQREYCNGSNPNTTRCGNNYIDNVQLKIDYNLSPIFLTASANTTSGKKPLSIQFNSTATGGTEIYNFTWQFGDGATSNIKNPIHVYQKTGTFTASVKVKDSQGHAYSRHMTIKISK